MDTKTYMKLCPACDVTKSVDDFYVNKQRNQPAGYCKICANRRRVEHARIVRAKLPKTVGWFGLTQDVRDCITQMMNDGKPILQISEACGVSRARLYYYKNKGFT